MVTDDGQSRARLEEKILGEAPRLTKKDKFKFACHPGVSCFGECCGDVNIVLTPYDALRLKNRLGLTSGELLAEHTIIPFSKEQKLPAPLIKMGDDEKQSCPFLDDGACTVYEDRPWACRMYPLGLASPGQGAAEDAFHFLLDEKGCVGHEEDRVQTVEEWISDQGIEEYDLMGELYTQLALDEFFTSGEELDTKRIEMYWTATYDLDSFRRFITQSTFLDRFEISPETRKKIEIDDVELLRFGFRWLEFALFGRPTMKIRENAIPEREQ